MELRHGVNCIEPILNKKTQKIEAVFLPCNFKDEQKWKLLSLSESNSVNDGKLSNVASGQCLTFKNKEIHWACPLCFASAIGSGAGIRTGMTEKENTLYHYHQF